MVDGSMATVERLTGTRPITCSWWSFRDLLTIDVLNVYPLFESGQLAFAAGNDPPAVLVDAVTVYHLALSRAGDVIRADREAERDAERRHAEAVASMRGGS